MPDNKLIPKIIHFCWFSGDEYPPLIKRCIRSWRKRLPDYEIRLWDANSFDFESVKYVKEALENRKYAFVSDYIRLYALYHFGGIYLDSDVMVYKRFDKLHRLKFFTGVEYRSMEEDKYWLEAAVMGSEPGNEMIRECMEFYETRPFVKPGGGFEMTPAPNVITPVFQKHYGWMPDPEEFEATDGVMVLGTRNIRNSEYSQWPRPNFYHCNSQSWIPRDGLRGRLYHYCKENNLQYQYKIFATAIQNILRTLHLQ